MKKNIFLLAFALISFTFSANAQCCSGGAAKAGCNKEAQASCADKSDSASVDEKTATQTAIVEVDQRGAFTVYGNCGMCEKTIEGALQGVEGIGGADWNKETHQMSVSYNSEIISLDDIKQKIAAVGYDSDDFRAEDGVYSSLPGCCQYERPKG